MRRAVRWLGWIVGTVAVFIVLLFAGANTGPGRRGIESLVAWGSGGSVRIIGLAGRFPDALRAKGVELRDTEGIYALAHNAEIDWSPLRLTGRLLAIDRLAIADVTLVRLPASDGSQSSGSSSPAVRVEVRAIDIAHITLGPAVAGVTTILAANGSGALTGPEAGHVELAVRGLSDGATYALTGRIDAGALQLHATVAEPAHGMLSRLADLPDLGAIALDAELNGPHAALMTRLTVDAGPLHASAAGPVNLQAGSADLTVAATAPAMRPAPDLAWEAIRLNARVSGPFTAPEATGHLGVTGLSTAGFSVDSIAADLSGNAGEATVRAALSGMHGGDPQIDALLKSSLTFDATARLDTPDRRARFAVHHDLLSVEGTAETQGHIRGHVTLTVPDLAPFAGVAGGKLGGHLAMTADVAKTDNGTQLSVDGTLAASGAPEPVATLLGQTATLHAAAVLRGASIAVSDLRINGHGVAVTADGTFAPDSLDLRGSAEIPDLAAIRPDLAGKLRIAAAVKGATNDLSAQADLTGSVAAAGVPSGPLSAHIEAHGLPAAPEGSLTAQGELLGAPLTLALTARRQGDAIHTTVSQADWKSAHAQGDLLFNPSDARSRGTMRLTIGRLDDFSTLLGQPLAGDATATLSVTDQQARIALAVHDAALAGSAGVARGTLDGTIDDPFGRPTLDATMALDGLRASGSTGSVSVKARGPTNAIVVSGNAAVANLSGAPLRLTFAGSVNADGKQTTVSSVEAIWQRNTVRLLAPVRIDFGDVVAIDRLRVGLDKAVLEASGQVAPALNLTATLRGLPVALADQLVPNLGLEGSIDAEARLSGSPAQPNGPVKITATGLRTRQGFGRTIPPARIDATATLATGSAQLDVRAASGRNRLTIVGRAPTAAAGPLDLRLDGNLDLALLNALLAANGRQVSGKVTVQATVGGSVATPRLSGTAMLAGGAFQDATLGMRLHAIEARLALDGDTLRLVNAKAQADPGTVGLSGTVGVLASGMPVDLTLTARDARPLASDALTASLDADVTVRGPIDAPVIGGTVRSRQIDIRVPEKLPSSVASIAVRDPARPPPAAPAPPPAIGLDVGFDAPNRVFVRGRGMDVELGGHMHLGGTLGQPRADGGLALRQGTISFAGQTLTFSKGTIGFNGAAIANPTIELISTTNNASVTVTLTVAGTAQAPKITLSSVPELPQDEILAQLLFKRSVSSLSPFEVAQIAAALASLSGAGPTVESPLSRVRSALGLDRLSVGTTASGGAAVEAGRYVAPGVYVGTKQGASGGGQATVRIDIARGLTLRGATSTGGGSATGSDPDTSGSSVGVGYQFEY